MAHITPPIHEFGSATGFLNVVQQNLAGVWGWTGLAAGAPTQNSSPPVSGGVVGQYTGGLGVPAAGVVGVGQQGMWGVWGQSDTENGVHGDSTQGDAVVGFAHAAGKAGVLGLSPNGNALAGISDHGTGIFAQGGQWAASFLGEVLVNGHIKCGSDPNNPAVTISPTGTVNCTKELFCGDPNNPAVTVSPSGTVSVTQDVILTNMDCAEDFDIGGKEAAPGTVMVIDEEGALQPCSHVYDKKVAGVVSGAGDFKPAIVLGRRESGNARAPVALVGKVYCMVDAENAPIEVGDLLTTSDKRGHAMKATDPLRAFGAVIGKALRPLAEGRGLIPVLVALQ
jgi:hypothetical protein